MPSKTRITLNPPPEVLAIIQAFREQKGHASDASAALALILAGAKAQGYDVPDAVPTWGGARKRKAE